MKQEKKKKPPQAIHIIRAKVVGPIIRAKVVGPIIRPKPAGVEDIIRFGAPLAKKKARRKRTMKTEDITADAEVERIKELHGQIKRSGEGMFKKALEIGEILTRKKSAMKHGQWLTWVKENLPFSQVTASAYMRLYANRDDPEIKIGLQKLAENRCLKGHLRLRAMVFRILYLH
ncbi:MAG: DUF3102 domain-containing protein [Deltaproteobacteria bacterium]|nr:DUF3102 domain-containing protein [Deltaproteobacteria bacterium]MBW2151776.1 DUF3102 domain-containing protein [Deltaproteobacteria bacterium]